MIKALTVDLGDTSIDDRPEADAARRGLRLTEIGKLLEEAPGFDFQNQWGLLEALRAPAESGFHLGDN